MLTQKQIVAFQKKILDWFAHNKRDLPWRHPSLMLGNGIRDPYVILVSEVMLQQTQVPRVIPKFHKWMKAFPDVKSLAQAPTKDVLSLWSGLGYNRRALYLQKAAIVISSKARNPQEISHHVRDDIFWYWSQTEEELRQLPGIGEYTAKALLCFAFNKQIVVVDTNVRKVILVHFQDAFNRAKGLDFQERDPLTFPWTHSMHSGLETNAGPAQDDTVIRSIADKLLPKGKAYVWNQALMDYAAAVLKKEKIAITKQSKFIDSDRYFRGAIVKLLLKQEQVTVKELLHVFTKQNLTQERLEKILAKMVREQLLYCFDEHYTIR